MIETVYPIRRSEESAATPCRKLPRNIRACGQGGGEFPVYMEDYVETYIRRLSESGFPDSSAAILVGQVMETEMGRSLFVRGAINGNRLCEGDRPVFEEALWNEIYEKIRRFFPGDEVVGWCIAGPGFRLLQEEVFLRVHIDNFADSEKVFLCYESLEKELTLRISKGGSFFTLPGYYIYYEKNDEMQSYMLEEAAFSAKKAENAAFDEDKTVAFSKAGQGLKPEGQGFKDKQKKREQQTDKRVNEKTTPPTGKVESVRKDILQLAAIACVIVLIISVMVGTGALPTLKEAVLSEKENEVAQGASKPDAEGSDSDAEGLTFADFDFLSPRSADNEKETKQTDGEAMTEENTQKTAEADTQKTAEESTQTMAEENPQTMAETDAQKSPETITSEVEAETVKEGSTDTTPAESLDKGEENTQKTAEAKPQDDPDIIFEETVSVLAPSEYISYIVEKGDMLAQICKEVYGSVELLNYICELNQLESVDCIYIGQELILPKK